jgi:membrane protease YdiL (CAAX protease family)
MSRKLGTLEFVTESLQSRPNRLDYSFTYKVKDFEPAPESDYRITVTVQGSEVAEYREYLRVPETWRQSYDKLRSYNQTTGSVASLFIVLTIAAMVAVIFFRLRNRDIRWKTAMWFGIIGFVLVFLNQLNMIPLSMLNYDTTASFSGFLIERLMQILLASILQGGVVIFLLTAAAETLYRERYGQFASISRMFSWRGWRTKSFFKGVLLGLTLTAFFFAYQIVFYLIADKFGAWSPADVPYSNLLNTAFPWLAVLLIGFFPAVSEEFISRAFSIPFLHKYLKSGFLAIVISAAIWGFGHAAYPNQPFYIRGLEVGFAGIIIGLVMLRWGILPALVWHYTVDALYTAFLLFRSGNWYFIVTAAVATGILVIPLLIALINYLRAGKFLPEEGIRNQDDITEAPPEAAPKEPAVKAPIATSYQPLTGGTRLRGIILGILCILVTLIPFQKLGDTAPEFKITRAEALRIADEFLVSQGVDVRDMKSGVDIHQRINGITGKYFLTLGGIEDFNRLTGDNVPPNLWEVRRFIPENRDQWYIRINPESGEIATFQHMLPEETEGDSLTQDGARLLVEAFMTERGINLEQYVLKNEYSTKRPVRMDHYFTYEAKEGDPRHFEEAKYRISFGVGGSKIIAGSLSGFYKIPEAWERERESTTALKAVFRVIRILAIAVFIGLAILFLVLLTKAGKIPWGKAALIGIIPTVITALNGFNFFDTLLYQYQVTIPYQMYSLQTLVAFIMSLIFVYLFWFLGTALLLGCYPKAPTDFRGVNRRAAGVDNLVAVFLGISFIMLLTTVKSALQAAFPAWIPFDGIFIDSAIARPVPFLMQFSSGLSGTLILLLIAGFGIYLWKNVLTKPWMRIPAILLFLFAVTPGAAQDLGEIVLTWISSILLLILFMYITVLYLRNNTLSYVAAAFGIVMFRKAMVLITPGTATVSHGIVVWALGLIVILWIVIGKRNHQSTD